MLARGLLALAVLIALALAVALSGVADDKAAPGSQGRVEVAR
jgi:hypothetical protein